jgi:hypothetical protein
MGRVGHIILLIFLSDSNLICLNSGQIFLTYTRPNRDTGRSDPTRPV